MVRVRPPSTLTLATCYLRPRRRWLWRWRGQALQRNIYPLNFVIVLMVFALNYFVWFLVGPGEAETHMSGGKEDRKMDPAQLVIPVLSIATAAAFTFYAVSFSEIREELKDSQILLQRKHTMQRRVEE